MLQLDTLDLRLLRAFQLVAKNGGLRVAASRLKQSLPAISAKIRRLESELGFELFDRLPNKLVLTPAGERFLHDVDELFEHTQHLLTGLNRVAPAGKITVSVGSDYAWYFAPKIRSFLNRYPNVTMNLRVYKSAEAIVAIEKGEIDIGFGIFPKLPSRFERVIINETTLSLAYNPHEFGSSKTKPGLEALAHRRMIVPPQSTVTRRLVDRSLAAELTRATTLIEAPTCETAANFVEMGVGVALVHTLCIKKLASPLVEFTDLGSRAGRVALCAIYRKGAGRAPLVQALLQESTIAGA